MISKVFLIIASIVDIPSQKNLLFENLKYFIDNSIIKVKLDYYDGNCSTNLNKQIREDLGSYIVSSTNIVTSYLPNFFTKRKEFNENIVVCKRQALYDNTLDVREIHELRLYVDPKTIYDNNAYTITSIYYDDSSNLTIYSTHSTLFNDF